MKYQTGGGFRRSLEQRLRNMSVQTGIPLARLRKMVAFDRFLARLIQIQPGVWVLKGGLALQLRLGEKARTTKDLDMLASLQVKEVTRSLRQAGDLDLGDWFAFEVSEPSSSPTAGLGGIRHTVQALLDGRLFEQFHVDVGVGDPALEAVDYLDTPALLTFADLPPTRVPCFPLAGQIAEKLHAYTRPHKSGESSRVKDFVDILLLSEFGKIEADRLSKAIQTTFSTLGTHPIPAHLPSPPSAWRREFVRMVKDVGMDGLSLDQAYDRLQAFLDPILRGEAVGCWWDGTDRIWR